MKHTIITLIMLIGLACMGQAQIIKQDIIIDSLSRDSVIYFKVARLTADTSAQNTTQKDLDARIRLFRTQVKISDEAIQSGVKRLDSIPDPLEKQLIYHSLVKQDRELAGVKTELFTLEQIRKKLQELKIMK